MRGQENDLGVPSGGQCRPGSVRVRREFHFEEAAVGKSGVTQQLRDITNILERVATFQGTPDDLLSLRRDARDKVGRMEDLIRRVRRAFDQAEEKGE
jgi:hypothetical protein